MKTLIFIGVGLAAHARTLATKWHLTFGRACLRAGFLAFATIAFGLGSAQAAVTEAWVQRYSNVQSNATAQAVKVVRDAAGDIIVTGTTAGGIPGADMVTIKYSAADGSVLWQQRYNNPNPSWADTRPSALAVDGSGNVVVAGNSDIGAIAPVYLGHTAKYAAVDGALLWEKHGNGTANRIDRIRAVAVDDSGNVVVTGSSLPGVGSELYTAKYAAADGALLWEKRYGSGGLTGVAVDGNGNVVVAGSSEGDYYTAKYAAADGALLWEQRYNGPADSSGYARAVAVDSSGNVVVTGSSYNGTNGDYYTAKYAAADGSLLWEKRYNGLANRYDSANAVAVDGSGNVVVTGYSERELGSEIYTVKYAAADGALVWEQRYNGPDYYDDATAVAVDGSGNVVVTGASQNGTNTDYYTAKYAAADGALLWAQRYNGPANRDDSAAAVAVDASGNIVVTGWSDVDPAFQWTSGDYYTAKYAAADGALLWEQRYDLAPYDASAQAVAVDGSGNVVVTGSAASHTDSFGNSSYDYYTAKYAAADGALLWEKRYNGPAKKDDGANAMAMDGSGNVVVTGYSYNGTNNDYYTAKYAAADGALLWEKRYNGPANSGDGANAMAMDGGGNVVVTGYSYNGTNNNYTAKYAAADGALLWEKRDNGGNTAVAVDGSGNVVVTGSSYNGANSDYYTAKYAAADGALLWEKRGSSGGARALAVDGSGNVVVTGSSYNGANSDYYTAKYATADGALLWEQRYNGPANDLDAATAVAVDGDGNVVVTGSSSAGLVDPFGTWNSDYYTAKYAAADGALLWEQRYNGPANSYDYAYAVAVDDGANVVVTGTSASLASFGNSIDDYYTVKYAAADGALLWEKRFAGPASSGEPSHCLALGPEGMVAVAGTVKGGYATVVYRDVRAGPRRQLIVNGGFEAPDTDTYIDISAGQDTIAPWVVGLHSVQVGDAVGNGVIFGPAFEGAQFLDLNGTGLGRLTQTFTTTPGLLYTVTFAYANNYYNASTASARVRILDGLGVRLNRTITHSSSVADNYDWTVFVAQFTAFQNTTSLEFTSLTDNYSGIMLDAVQVFEGAPEIDSITRAGNGPVVLKVRGFPNGVHRIQASVDLSAGSFSDIGTVTADAAGLFQFEDTRTGLTKNYYRVVYP